MKTMFSVKVGGDYCCKGYCIDLLEKLRETCNFTYDLYVSFDDYGTNQQVNGTGKKQWTGNGKPWNHFDLE